MNTHFPAVKFRRLVGALALSLALIVCPLFAGEIAIERALALGPFSWQELGDWSASDQTESLKKVFVQRLDLQGLPTTGASMKIFGKSYSWREVAPEHAPNLLDRPGILALSLNLDVDRYLEGTLKADWTGKLDLFLDNASVSGSREKGYPLKIKTGSHRLLLLLQRGQDAVDGFGLSWASETDGAHFHIAANRLVSAEQLFHSPTVQSLAISPDGKSVALTIRGYDTVSGQWSQHAEIRASEDGRLQRQWLENPPSSFAWSPDNRRLAYQIGENLWVETAETGQTVRLIEGLAGLGPFRWSRDGRSLFFQWSKSAPKVENGVKRYRALEDRWTGWRDNSQIYQVDLETGLIRQRTQDDVSSTLFDESFDGGKILFQQSPVDYAKPPHSATILKELDLASGELKELGSFPSLTAAFYTTDGLYLLAGPDEFEGLGSVLATGVVANDFDTQLYRIRNGKPEALSRDFAPSIGGGALLKNGDLILNVAEGEESPLYLFHAKTGTFERVAGPATIVESFAVSAGDQPVMVWCGTGPTLPQKVYSLKLGGGATKQIHDPAPRTYSQTRFGNVNPWVHQKDSGESIDGRYYTPPDFDPAKKYPLIVYYYGGTSTVDEAFTGRYPFNLWAANGYVIYVPQPSGAVGYGQAFSARHVNAWGKYTADDIIEATKAFSRSHDFVDQKKIGCMGASYGGFMTMSLITRTDLFAAAISHAGISSLTGYWGKGWWGFQYSGVASKGSFPWNNRDLYVDQSPVYHADKITTPLLLLTGDADTNVPPEQSHVMYTALKLLGKDVELVTVEGQNHWILEHDKRFLWWDAILAWFDMKLKDQPEWWDALFPE